MEDLLASDMKYGTVKNTGLESFFKETSDELYMIMYKFMQDQDGLVDTLGEGIQRARNKEGISPWAATTPRAPPSPLSFINP